MYIRFDSFRLVIPTRLKGWTNSDYNIKYTYVVNSLSLSEILLVTPRPRPFASLPNRQCVNRNPILKTVANLPLSTASSPTPNASLITHYPPIVLNAKSFNNPFSLIKSN